MFLKIFRIAIIFVLIIIAPIKADLNNTPEATLFVATSGSDSWSGKLPEPNKEKTDGPFATIEKARDAIRELKAKQSVAKPVTVMIRAGTYFLDKALVFMPQDSGTKSCPIIYTAHPGEKPILSGGRKITEPWKTYKDKILVCNIKNVKDGKWIFRQLFADGKRQSRSRIPNQGFYKMEKPTDKIAFKYEKGNFKNWQNLNDVEVIVCHSWNESRLLINEINEQEKIVKFVDAKARHPINWSGATLNQYYIENVLEGLDEPGEWYLDKHTGKLYYRPTRKIEDSEIIAPVLNQLMRFQGNAEKNEYVQYITVSGLTFSDTDWILPEKGYPDCGDVGDIVEPSAITLDGVRYCTLKDNLIKNVGTYAIEVNGHGNKITGNKIFDVGSGGIITRSFSKEQNIISYNHIHHCGVVFHSAVGINIDDGGGIISHNLIHDMPHSGIYTRHWSTRNQPLGRRNQQQGLIIEYNEIYNCSQILDDTGGIFVRDSDIIIRNNLIHDVYCQGRCPGWGIYLGCETRNTKVENNIVYRTTESVHVWYKDRNITLENNIFIDGKRTQINYQNPRNLSHENVKFLRNIIYYSDPAASLFRISGTRSAPVESDYNIFFCPSECICRDSAIQGMPGTDTWEKWQEAGFDIHSVVSDPLFLDAANNVYFLDTNSPAFEVGFKPIDISEVGLRAKKTETY